MYKNKDTSQKVVISHTEHTFYSKSKIIPTDDLITQLGKVEYLTDFSDPALEELTFTRAHSFLKPLQIGMLGIVNIVNQTEKPVSIIRLPQPTDYIDSTIINYDLLSCIQKWGLPKSISNWTYKWNEY